MTSCDVSDRPFTVHLCELGAARVWLRKAKSHDRLTDLVRLQTDAVDALEAVL